MTRSNGIKVAFLAAAAVVLLAAGARDAAAACTNDDDCPNPACGGDVCTWDTRGMTCEPAGGKPAGQDGWCTTNEDCKCKGEGATCVYPYCTFTKLASSGTGGASATGGSSGAGTGGASAGTGGASSGTGGASAGTGGAAGTTPPKDGGGGGCAVAGAPAGGTFASLAGAALLGLVLAARRRSRR
jgi:MYXO-CTERM domain-containing protein